MTTLLLKLHRPGGLLPLKLWRWKSNIIQTPEESHRVFIARQIFEIVCDREISDHPEEALSGLAFYKHLFKDNEKLYYYMPSKVFLALVHGAGFRFLRMIYFQQWQNLEWKNMREKGNNWMTRGGNKTPILHIFHERRKKIVSSCLVYIWLLFFARHH